MRYATFPHSGPVLVETTHRDIWSSWAGLPLLVLGFNAFAVLGALVIDPTQLYGTMTPPWWAPTVAGLGAAAAVALSLAGISAWVLCRHRDDLDVLARWGLGPYPTMLLLIALWPIAMFGVEAPAIAAGIGVALFVVIVVTMLRASVVSRDSWLLLAPLMVATGIAVALSISTFVINPDAPLMTLPTLTF